MTEEQEKIFNIVDRLRQSDDLYYNTGESLLSNGEYDRIKDELRSLDPGNDYLKTIGATVPRDTPWEKATHKISMSSLSKVNTEEELEKWLRSISFFSNQTLVLQEKLDGLSINCEYEDGVLKRGITRGTGIQGENIFENVRRMQNVKSTIPDFTGCVRGEIIMLAKDFEKLCETESAKNSRNSSVGISKRFDHKYSELLTVLFYDIKSDDFEWESEDDKITFLQEQGMRTVPNHICSSIKDVMMIYKEYENSRRSALNYEIDGLVLKLNNIEKQEKLGYSSDERPIGQVAFKFGPLIKIAKVINVDWQLGRSGKITPVIYIEPTQMGGVTISKMTCFNIDIFKKLKLYRGCNLKFKKANDVIPVPIKVIDE